MKAERRQAERGQAPFKPPCPCCGQDRKGFAPVILTIETEEEANLLWHLLNNAPTRSFQEYLTDYQKGINVADKTNMWKVLNNGFCPKDE